MRFKNRSDAGRRLAVHLSEFASDDVVVLGLPRGGVPVAFEVAIALGAPLDVILVRKLGVPFQPEYAMGAIGEDGVLVVNDDVAQRLGVSASDFAATEHRERAELERRAQKFRGDRDRVSLVGRTALIIDDGIATGSTARAACLVARAHGAARVVLAAPVAPRSSVVSLRRDCDQVIVLGMPDVFMAIGEFYDDFTQVGDEEVVELLRRAGTRAARSVPEQAGGLKDRDEEVTMRAGSATLTGHLRTPAGSTSVVVFAHGSGSSRHSPRNQFVAEVLNHAGLGTLLFDLLTPAEADNRANVFDIELLAGRLGAASDGIHGLLSECAISVGYFGASTGAAAALWAAAEPGRTIGAVVSRGGRPDLAGPRLASVRAPTLLVVGGDDDVVLDLNRRARAQMRCETSLAIVPHATHLFEEPGTLEQAANLARDWFVDHLTH